MNGQGGNYYPGGYFNPYAPYQAQMQFNNSNQSLSPQESTGWCSSTSPTIVSSHSFSGSASDSSQTSISSQPSSSSKDVQPRPKAKKTYDKFTEEQQKALVNMWAEKYDELDSKDNRKVWDDIAQLLNNKFKLKRDTDKYKQKMKYLIDRYKIAKDWNRNQSGGNRRESPFYNCIDQVLGCRDVVTLQHVADVGASKITASNDSASDENDEESTESKQEKRTERKKSRKRARADKDDSEERELLANAFKGMNEQRESMSRFMEDYSKAQKEQTQTMNALVGALTSFLQNSNKKD